MNQSASTKKLSAKEAHQAMEIVLWENGVKRTFEDKLLEVKAVLGGVAGRPFEISHELGDEAYTISLYQKGGHQGEQREVVLTGTMEDSMMHEDTTKGFSIKLRMEGFIPDAAWEELCCEIPENNSRVWSQDGRELMERIRGGLDWDEIINIAVDHLTDCTATAETVSGLRAASKSKLPDDAFVWIHGNTPAESVGLVKRGEPGYTQMVGHVAEDGSVVPLPATHEEAKALVKELNERRGVTPLQAQCMLVGSMFGWDVPGADPAQTTLRPE